MTTISVTSTSLDHTAPLMDLRRHRLVAIDSLRGIAVLAVLFMHAREVLWVGVRLQWMEYGFSAPAHVWVGYLSSPMKYGYQAVMLFFVLSGYCIHRAHIPRPGQPPLDLRRYVSRRFFRIYPVLFCALVLTAILDGYVRRYYPLDEKLESDNWKVFAINLLALQGLAGPCFGTNGPLWSLAIEIHLYALYPVLLWLRHQIGPSLFFWFPLTLSSAMAVVHYLHPSIPVNAMTYYFVWALGCLVAELEAGTWVAPKLPYFAIAITSYALALLFAFYRFSIIENLTIGIPFSILLGWIVLGGGLRIWSSAFASILCWFGWFSYSLYATHLPVLVFTRAMFFSGSRSNNIVTVGVGILLAIVVARIFFQFFEKKTLSATTKAVPSI